MEVNLKGKNVLVTGGTGFVGSHLVEELVSQLANVTTTYLTLNPKSYFCLSQLHNKVTTVPLDISNYDGVFDLVTKGEIEYIFHLAAQAIVETAYYNPRRTFESNITGTINILESARLYPKVKGVIVASSDKAYGKLNKKQYLESDPVTGDHPYDVSKSVTDLLCSTYYKTYNTPVVITRFGNIYGPGDLNLSRIIPGIMKALHTQETLEIRSDGTFVRDYLHVKDVVDGYILLARNINKVKGEVFNFGSHDTFSVLETLAAIEKALGTKIPYVIQNRAKNEIPYQSLNYGKIRKLFGWKASRTMASSAQEVYNWYKEYLSIDR